MATNPFGAGVRQWRRITEALRATSTAVIGKGELVVSDGGKAYVPDGTKQLKDLSPLIDAASVAATYSPLPTAGTTPGYVATVGPDGKSITYSAATGGGGLTAADNGLGGITTSSTAATDNGLGGIAA